MIKNIYLGFNVFTNKIKMLYGLIIFILLSLISFFTFNFYEDILKNLQTIDTNLINHIFYIINTLKINIIWLLILFFVMLFLLTYLIYVLSKNNTKIDIYNDISKVFKFTLLEIIVFILVTVVFIILGTYVNLLTIILMILLVILIIFILLLFLIANIILGIKDTTIKKSLEESKTFLKNYFWSTIGFFILIYIVYFITYLIVDLIYIELFFINQIFAGIFFEIYLLFIAFYAIYAMALFIKSRK